MGVFMVQIKLHESVVERADLQQQLKNFPLQINDTAALEVGFDANWWVKDLQGRRLQIDFDQNKNDYFRSHKGSGEPLARALGFKEGIRHVIDLTAGLGIDSVFLARLGFHVQALERHPLLAFLLTESKRLSTREDLKSLEFQFLNAFDFLNEMKITHPTSVYYDPMYPEKKKSALPRQEMVIFREMVGGDLDSEKVLGKALSMPVHKIVVKRPVRAEPIMEKPAYQLTTKLIRYDVYYPSALDKTIGVTSRSSR